MSRSLASVTAAVGALSFAAVVQGATVYSVSIDTRLIGGTSTQVAFDFIDGGSPSNTVVISGFVSDGSLGSQAAIGDVTGALPGTFTLGDSQFFNELLVGLTLGSTLVFHFEATANSPDAGSVPDSFSLFMLDLNTQLPLFPTSTPSGADALLQFDIDGSPPSAYRALGGEVTITVAQVQQKVPEPGTFLLASLALAALACQRRRREGTKSLTGPYRRLGQQFSQHP